MPAKRQYDTSSLEWARGGISPTGLHSMLFSIELETFCQAAYGGQRQDGAAPEAVYDRLLWLCNKAQETLEFRMPEKPLTVGFMLRVARLAWEDESTPPLKNRELLRLLREEIIYLLLLKPYGDVPISKGRTRSTAARSNNKSFSA